MSDVEKRWTEIAKMLEGRTIVHVRYLTEEEAEDWFGRPVVMFLDNGEYIIPIADDEGNDGGALATSYEDHSVLPVM
jgi:hypothetical protein